MTPDLNNQSLRVGLIGAGMIGQLRARALAQVPEIRLVAVADPQEALARRVADAFPGIRIFSDGMALAEDSEVEAVILATPPAFHEYQGLACLTAGKHLLCEKPLAITVAACETLVRAAEEAGVSLATGFNLRYTRAARLARQLLESGGIGELDHIRAFHGHPGGKEFTHAWVFDRSKSGGGALMDNGIHLIDLTRWFLGEVQDVVGYASNHTWHKPGCEDNGFLLLRNAHGRVATLQASWTEWRGYGYRLEIYGTQGFIRFGYPPLHLIHGQRRADGTVKVRRHFFPAYQVLERVRGWEWGLVETLTEDVRAWALALSTGSTPPISGLDGLEAVRIAQAAESCPANPSAVLTH
jgi:predicted dehydrogenase